MIQFYRALSRALALSVSFLALSCNSPDSGKAQSEGNLAVNGDPQSAEALFWRKKPSSPPNPPSPAPTPVVTATPVPSTGRKYSTDVMIFNGAGTNASDAQSLIDIVASHGLTYHVIDSTQLNSMSAAAISDHGVLVWPGGDSNVMDASFTSDTRLRVYQAVHDYGVSFTGFCAGAWIAVGPPPGSQAPYWGFSIVAGSYLKEYYPNAQIVSGGVIVPITFANATVRDLVWWQGPFLPSLPGGIIAKYSTGEAAIVESWSGKGYVTISGVHPEAPQSWRYGLVDPDGLDFDVAWSMINSALTKTPLQVF